MTAPIEIAITLASEADKPNRNGHIYPVAVLEQIAQHLNAKGAPLTLVASDQASVDLEDMIGEVVKGSARVEDGRVQTTVKLMPDRIPAELLDRVQRTKMGFAGYSGSLDAGKPHGKRILASVTEISAVNYIAISDIADLA